MGTDSVNLIVMATRLEAKPFITGLTLPQTAEKPFFIYENENLALVISGIGKSAAAMATAYACQKLRPARVCNAGAAGALDTTCSLGSIYQIKKIIEHDRPDIFTGLPVVHKPDRLSGLADLKEAVLATGDRPVTRKQSRTRLAGRASLVDMEAAAVVQACRLWEVPCHVFKFVSDEPAHAARLKIVANIRAFRSPFFRFFQDSLLPRLI